MVGLHRPIESLLGPVLSEVPQGSTLNPILFPICITIYLINSVTTVAYIDIQSDCSQMTVFCIGPTGGPRSTYTDKTDISIGPKWMLNCQVRGDLVDRI